MSPTKQRFVGLAGCFLVSGGGTYRLRDGQSTCELAITLSLMFAEPSLRRHKHKPCVAISCEAAAAMGCQVVRTYDDAAFGLTKVTPSECRDRSVAGGFPECATVQTDSMPRRRLISAAVGSQFVQRRGIP
jgi:hypothetical protein